MVILDPVPKFIGNAFQPCSGKASMRVQAAAISSTAMKSRVEVPPPKQTKGSLSRACFQVNSDDTESMAN